MWGGWEGVGLVEGGEEIPGKVRTARWRRLPCLLRSNSAGFSVVALNVTVDEWRKEFGAGVRHLAGVCLSGMRRRSRNHPPSRSPIGGECLMSGAAGTG